MASGNLWPIGGNVTRILHVRGPCHSTPVIGPDRPRGRIFRRGGGWTDMLKGVRSGVETVGATWRVVTRPAGAEPGPEEPDGKCSGRSKRAPPERAQSARHLRTEDRSEGRRGGEEGR